MKNKINIHNFWRSDAFIVLMFAVMSVMSVAVMWNSHFVILSDDMSFHWQRIREMHDSLLRGNLLPKVSLNTFNQTGSSVISLYPNLNIYPMALLTFFIKHFLPLFYVIRIFRNCFALIIGYYSCKNYTGNKKIGFIFSIAYTLSTTTLSLQTSFMLGNTSAIIFMPMVLFGFLNLLKENKWIGLTVGMIAIILCHILDTIIISLLLLLLLVLNLKKVNSNTVKAIVKSFTTILLVTSIFWTPLLILMFKNNISSPDVPVLRIQGQTILMLFSSFLPRMSIGISLASLLGLVLSVIMYKNISATTRRLTLISFVFLFLSSDLFPWSVFHHTMIETILQFPWRLLIIPNMIFSYIFAKLVIYLVRDRKKQLYTFMLIVCILLFVQIICQIVFVHRNQNLSELNNIYNGNNNHIIVDDYDFNNLIKGYKMKQYDYYPKQSIKMYDTINHHLATYDGNKHIKMKLLGNGGYEFSNESHIKDLSLPFLYYNGINYQVKLDGKTVDGFANKNSLMTIKNVNKGQHHVRIIVHNTKMQIVSYITSLIGLIILLGAVIRKYILRK